MVIIICFIGNQKIPQKIIYHLEMFNHNLCQEQSLLSA